MYIYIYIRMYMYIHIYICMYVYIYMHVYICMYIYISMYTYIYVYIHIYRYIYIYICMYIVIVCWRFVWGLDEIKQYIVQKNQIAWFLGHPIAILIFNKQSLFLSLFLAFKFLTRWRDLSNWFSGRKIEYVTPPTYSVHLGVSLCVCLHVCVCMYVCVRVCASAYTIMHEQICGCGYLYVCMQHQLCPSQMHKSHTRCTQMLKVAWHSRQVDVRSDSALTSAPSEHSMYSGVGSWHSAACHELWLLSHDSSSVRVRTTRSAAPAPGLLSNRRPDGWQNEAFWTGSWQSSERTAGTFAAAAAIWESSCIVSRSVRFQAFQVSRCNHTSSSHA